MAVQCTALERGRTRQRSLPWEGHRTARRAATSAGRSGPAAPLRSGSEPQSPLVEGDGGREEAVARAERSGAGAFLVRPLAGRIGKARRSVCSSALPRRRGAGTRPGSPAACGGCPAVALYQRLHRPVRGRLRRQAYRSDSLSASQGRWPPRAATVGSADEGSSRSWPGHTAAVVTTHACVLATRSYPHALGKRECGSR